MALAIVNATLGDELAAQGSPLAIRMAVRLRREDVPPRRNVSEVAFPEATSKVAVFVHGLGEKTRSRGAYTQTAMALAPSTPTGCGSRTTSGTPPSICATTPASTYPRSATSAHGTPRRYRCCLADSRRRVDPGGSFDGRPRCTRRVPLCPAGEPIVDIGAPSRLLPGLSSSGGRTRAVGQPSKRCAGRPRRESSTGIDP